MLSQKETIKSKTTLPITSQNHDSVSYLKFTSDLVKSLSAIFSTKIAVEAIVCKLQTITESRSCAVVFYTDEDGLVGSVADSFGDICPDSLNSVNIKSWLAIEPEDISFWQDDKADFLTNIDVKREYIVPLVANNETRGAVIVGFDDEFSCLEEMRQLIETTAQIASNSLLRTVGFGRALTESVAIVRKEQQIFTDAILDSLPVSLYVIDREFRVVAWNRHREIGDLGLPREEVIGRNIFDFLTKQPRAKLIREFERAFRTGNIERIEQHTVDKNGAIQHWLVSKIPMRDKKTNEISHVITVGEDITMRVDAMHAVTRAEKLAAVGRLAAGVVHEINNPLATVSACAEALELRVSEGVFGDSEEVVDLREYLGLIRSEAFRCKSITNGLLDFSRVRSGNRTPLDISDVVKSSARLLSHQKRGDGIEIIVDVPVKLLIVSADEGQLQQAIIALATNAIDAMPNGGKLVLRAFAEKNRVVLEIKDSGIGISEEDLPKIFEPFFTTKEVGKGTGLGLAVCYGIITEHGGKLSVRSSPNVGTTFAMYLPAHT
jgi:two-component system, NtrC family, sensor kinase